MSTPAHAAADHAGEPPGTSGAARLDRFNARPEPEALDGLLACCAAAAWARRVAAGRPYRYLDDVLAASDDAVTTMTDADLADALAGHPRIGERRPEPGGPGSRAASWSSQEQAGMRDAGQQASEEMAGLNQAYEDRFGHIYLVCATGRSAAELAGLLRARLGNDPRAERGVVRAELAQINRLRLARLLAEDA
ncbi:MAG TPA: 2-oxo-4-hydroxy-4-carboxy-5-ureidoimidazoline decarboxylase [Streptosporangiaceae bacterium]|jgi:2-oxo-4-hydroxy-4-carboxy-5-ureidoimidazoline decarboxylase